MVMKKNIDAMNHPTKVKESIGERIYTIVWYRTFYIKKLYRLFEQCSFRVKMFPSQDFIPNRMCLNNQIRPISISVHTA